MNPTLGAHMTTYQYLIIGGGMAADSAAHGIREIDKDGSIAILSADVDSPYPRPALSKKLWTDPEFTWDKTDLATAADTGAELRLDTEVLSIDRDAKTVLVGSGQVFGYQKLLLVTGLTPSRIDDDGDAVLYFRSARDYQKLRALAQPGHHLVIIGGGYIGAELAAALVQQGCEVSLVTPDPIL
ncbi:MAG: FAD/NAD(P)-binding oxidoreductase, partial [Cutibacterium avidum]|nr:FAD/NAD(P)-binding oxidoreductase [Cutibacterium avidum]